MRRSFLGLVFQNLIIQEITFNLLHIISLTGHKCYKLFQQDVNNCRYKEYITKITAESSNSIHQLTICIMESGHCIDTVPESLCVLVEDPNMDGEVVMLPHLDFDVLAHSCPVSLSVWTCVCHQWFFTLYV